MNIIFEDRQEKIKLNEDIMNDIKNIMIECLNYEGYDDDYDVSLSFVDNDEIRELNREFRNIDKATDVLSFPLFTEEAEENFAQMPFEEVEFGEISLGDIVISLERAKEQSVEYNHSLKREVCFLVCHSMFHLLGYDHDTDENTKDMRKREKDILNKLNITKE
ncbi:MAG: rRNA maturation RNase YbeY [Clostridioides sp.]|jgi:probable rRNA maturation factor|nr:rRNA maturation RNase YbeY [Clostridioides sp.]